MACVCNLAASELSEEKRECSYNNLLPSTNKEKPRYIQSVICLQGSNNQTKVMDKEN